MKNEMLRTYKRPVCSKLERGKRHQEMAAANTLVLRAFNAQTARLTTRLMRVVIKRVSA